MSGREDEQLQDDFEVDISDLDEDDGTDHVIAVPMSSRISLRSRHSPQQRLWRLTVTIGVIVLTSAIFLGNDASLRNTTTGLFFVPTPTPTPILAPGANFFYIDASPPWGKLFLDGYFIAHPPVMELDAPLHLARGRHQFVWYDYPFRTVNCFLMVPASSADTCHTIPAIQDEVDPRHPTVAPGSWKVLFYQSLNTLITGPGSLIQAVQSALDARRSTEIVYPGERYIHIEANKAIDVATRPLRATNRLVLDTADMRDSACTFYRESCTIQVQGLSQDCLAFCTQPNQYEYAGNSWTVLVVVHTVWDYATLDGQQIASDQPDVLPDVMVSGHLVTLQIRWDGRRWHVFDPMQGASGDDLACASANDAASKLQWSSAADSASQNTFSSYAAGSVRAAGCLLMVALQLNTTSAPPSFSSSTAAYFLYRFGIFVAANNLAHDMWPGIPLADAYEWGLAQKIAAVNQA